MLINLLGNAVKFTSVGSVELAVAPVDPVTPGADCRLRFTVQDTGPGIAAEDLAAIFEPFVQVANGQTVQEGTRPGQQLHPGNPGADRGGCRACAGRDRAAPDATGPGQPVYRQLVVEDSAESRKLLADLLARLGFEVRTAENGQQALKVWAEWQPHLIWMDMRIPVMDGREATRRIKATEQGQQTVVIAVSAGVLAGRWLRRLRAQAVSRTGDRGLPGQASGCTLCWGG